MLLFFDASGLAKRYFTEVGSDTINALFAASPLLNMAATPWGYTETYSILQRRRNTGILDAPTFSAASDQLRVEVVDDPLFGILPISDEIIFASISIIDKHNLNATDAAILTMLLQALPSPPPTDFILIASDKRLLRAAEAEGIVTLNPEELPASDVPDFLAAI